MSERWRGPKGRKNSIACQSGQGHQRGSHSGMSFVEILSIPQKPPIYPNLSTLVLGIQTQVHMLLQQIPCTQPSLLHPPLVFLFIFNWRQSYAVRRPSFLQPLSAGITDMCYQTCYVVQRIGFRFLCTLGKHSADWATFPVQFSHIKWIFNSATLYIMGTWRY